jgi:glycosyltransferase involved in cell wall biosynthesis
MKIAFIGNLPAASVMPQSCIRAKDWTSNHPAPWMVALLPALAKSTRHELRVFLPQRAVTKHEVVVKDGVEYEGIPTQWPERFLRKTLYFQKSMAVRKAIRQFRPDLIHAFGFETGNALIALRTGFPVSCFIQGIAEDYFPYYKQRPWIDRHVGRWGEKVAVPRVPWMVAETEYAKTWALRRNPEAHVAIIPHPLRRVFLEKAAPSYGPVVVTVGTLDERKGMDTIIRALALIENKSARLVVVGKGPLRQPLGELANSLGVADRIEFAGPLDTDGVIARMNEAGVYVIASRADTSPNVLSEAHAVGLPVVGTRAGGIPEMIDEGEDGFVVDVDDEVAMARRLEELLADPERARRMGEVGREKVRALNDPARIAEAHVEFFEKIRGDLQAD